MVIIWGSGLYGKVDQVPQLCHVATRFGHLYYIPLIPLGSYAIFEQHGDDFRGAPLPLSLKSVLVAWSRAGLAIGSCIAAIYGLISIAERRPMDGAASLVLAAVAIALFVGSYYWSALGRANYRRAKFIGEQCGLNPLGMLMIEVAYGRMSAAEADAELAKATTVEAQAHPSLASIPIEPAQML